MVVRVLVWVIIVGPGFVWFLVGPVVLVFRSQLERHDGEAVRRQPPPPGLAVPLRELNPED